LQNFTIQNALIDMWVKKIKTKKIFSCKINF
jgi:hypothetical protein